jgi:hypothetical protein
MFESLIAWGLLEKIDLTLFLICWVVKVKVDKVNRRMLNVIDKWTPLPCINLAAVHTCGGAGTCVAVEGSNDVSELPHICMPFG